MSYAITFTLGLVAGCHLTLFLLRRWGALIDGHGAGDAS